MKENKKKVEKVVDGKKMEDSRSEDLRKGKGERRGSTWGNERDGLQKESRRRSSRGMMLTLHQLT